MKRIMMIAAGIIIMATLTTVLAKDTTMSVQIRKGSLRTTPTFLGSVVGNVEYGEKLIIDETRGEWLKATSQSSHRMGWIHNSAVTKKDIKMQAGDKTAEVAASSGELALAGKGFNSDVEAAFKSKNADIDFTWVDKMEKIKIEPEAMLEFIRKGLIAPKAGAK